MIGGQKGSSGGGEGGRGQQGGREGEQVVPCRAGRALTGASTDVTQQSDVHPP